MVVTKVPYQDTTAMGVYLERGPAPAGGAVFTLGIKSGQPDLITFPPTVAISEGETGAQFIVTWDEVGTTILEAQLTEYGGEGETGTIYEADIECLSVEAANLSVIAPVTLDGLVESTIDLVVVFSAPVDGDQDVDVSSDDETIAETQVSQVTVLDTEQTAIV